MDVYCHVCGEPTGVDYFHDVADMRGTTFRTVQRDFQARGCVALNEDATNNSAPSWCERPEGGRSMVSMASEVLNDLLGDDIDGIASSMEDFAFLGMLDEPT